MQITVANATTHTRNHWRWARGWRPGRRKYAFHLTWEQSPALQELAVEVADTVGRFPELDVIPSRWLHLTMTGVGFTDEVSPEHMQRIAEPVFATWQQLESPVLSFDGLLVADEALMLTAPQPPWLARLIDSQRQACDRILGAREWGGFRPHVSLTYSNGETPIEPIVDLLRPIAARIGDPINATPVLTLLRIGKDNRMYEWDVMRNARVGVDSHPGE